MDAYSTMWMIYKISWIKLSHSIKLLKEPENDKINKIDSKPRQVVHFNKPFSYYYQVLERNENKDSSN